jgi:hypothetical protein
MSVVARFLLNFLRAWLLLAVMFIVLAGLLWACSALTHLLVHAVESGWAWRP